MEDRTFLLKTKDKLEEMNPNDTDIECSNVMKRYAMRPRILENWPLADYVSKLIVVFPTEMEDNYCDDYTDDPTVIEDSENYVSTDTDVRQYGLT